MSTKQNSIAARRKVCVITGSRAEYGLLHWLMRALRQAPDVTLQVIATAAHLSPEFGHTWREIEADGFEIDEKIEMLLATDSGVGIAKSIGIGTVGLADALARCAPDIMVVLGDRFETLAAASAAMAQRIPIAHIHGGELTEGLIDEAIRHAVTKMAHLHFVSAEPFRRRIIQLGEQPDRVFTTGGLGADRVAQTVPIDRAALERDLGIELRAPVFLVTYHPVTLYHNAAKLVRALLEALSEFVDGTFIITGTNADTDGRKIEQQMRTFAEERQGQALWTASLGQRRYVNAMRHADVVVGNSSSGLLEAPHVGVPTVNVGIRQQGRLRAPSVIDCEENAEAIRAALEKALSPEFKAIAARQESPYGAPGASKRMCQILREVDLTGIMVKKFYDLDEDFG